MSKKVTTMLASVTAAVAAVTTSIVYFNYTQNKKLTETIANISTQTKLKQMPLDRAIETLEQLISKENFTPKIKVMAQELLSNLYIENKEKAKAIRILKELIDGCVDCDMEKANSFYYLGIIEQEKNLNKAQIYFKEGVAIMMNNVSDFNDRVEFERYQRLFSRLFTGLAEGLFQKEEWYAALMAYNNAFTSLRMANLVDELDPLLEKMIFLNEKLGKHEKAERLRKRFGK